MSLLRRQGRFLARRADEAAQLLRIAARVFCHEAGQRAVIADELQPQGFHLMQLQGLPRRTQLRFGHRLCQGFDVGLPHQLAHVLTLPPQPLVATGAAQLFNGVAQGVVHGKGSQPLRGQGGQRVTEGLHVVRSLLQGGFARAFTVAVMVPKVCKRGGVMRVVMHPSRRRHGLARLTALMAAVWLRERRQGGCSIEGFGSACTHGGRYDKPMPSTNDSTTPAGFSFTQEQFQQLVDDTLAMARRQGASDAAVAVSEGIGLSVSVRKGDVENVERNRDKSIGVTVFVGQRRGNASTSDFSTASLQQTVQAAYDIARYTAEDPAAGLPDEQDLVTAAQAQRDLDLHHPWNIDAAAAAELARQAEDAALRTDSRITNSEGAGVSAQQGHFYAGNSRGFRGGYASSRHSLSVSPIAGKGRDMQRDYWYTSERDPARLADAAAVGRYAAERSLARLKSRKIPTCEVPVLFESPLAAGLVGAYVQATSGGALYRKASFLMDSLGQQVTADHLSIEEDPFIPQGKGSAPFDDEGVCTQPRTVLKDGVVQTYFLSSYSARKLGLRTTGHAGGSHNLRLHSRLTQAGDDLPAMLRKLHRGLFVVELIGQGVNYVTGDYSRGAAGFWVENGEIAYPVQEITIAGQLQQMLKGIVAVGADTYTTGSKTTGSVLIDRMKVAGA